MTVENTQNKMPPLQMGTTNEYPFTFAVLLQDPTEEEALEAIKASVLQADGTEIELVYNTDYTVTLNTDRIGGTLTVNDIRTSSDYITIYRQYAQTQEVDYKDFNSAPAETFEQCFDKLTMLSQQQQEEINRSIKLPVSSDITNLSLPNPVAGRTLKWNESETGLINSDVSIDEIDDSVQAALEASINATQQAEIASDTAKEVVEKASEVDNIWSEIVEGNMFKLQIFDTIVKDHILTYEESKGLALQGTYVYKDAIAGERWGYSDFYAQVVKEYNEATETETVNGITVKVHSNGHKFFDIADKASIDAFYNTMGTAWFYGIDTENERIFLPRDKYFAIKGNVPVAGNGKAVTWTNGTSEGTFSTSHNSNNICHSSATNLNVGDTASHSTWSPDLKAIGVTTDPEKSGIEAHLTANEDKYLYICVGNTVTDTSWVDVVTQVEGGVKDLEDKTLEGIERLKQSSTALTQSQITNCLLEVPQRIKLELNNGTLTLKAGSIVIVPNGFEEDGVTPKFDYVTIESDVTDTADTQRQAVIWCRKYNGNYFISSPIPPNYCYSGSTAPTSFYAGSIAIWYDTKTNLIKYTENSGTTWDNQGHSLPLAIVTETTTSFTSIDQVFNGMGYIGSTVWVDKGVVNLIADGRNDVGSLINQERTTPRIVTHTIPSAWGKKSMEVVLNYSAGEVPKFEVLPTYRFTKNGVLNTTQGDTWTWTYYENDNKWFISGDSGATWYQIIAGFLGTLEFDGTKVTEFNPKQPFRAVDYNDVVLKNSVDWSKKVNKTVSTTYTAESNGYVIANGSPSGNNNLICTINGVEVINLFMHGLSGVSYDQCFTLPVAKGDTYNVVGANKHYYFLPFKEV